MRKVKTLDEFKPGRGFTQKDWDEVSDNPEWTAEDFVNARPFAEVFPELAAKIRRGRGPNKAPTKAPVSLRLSPGVVKYFKDQGPGWQRRIDDALRKVAGLDKALDKAAGRGAGTRKKEAGARKKAAAGSGGPASKKRRA